MLRVVDTTARWFTRGVLLLILLPGLVLSGCDGTSETREPEGEFATARAVVFGQVQTSAGAPVSGAQLTIEAISASGDEADTPCARIREFATVRPETQADGTFDTFIDFLSGGLTGGVTCLIVTARADAAATDSVQRAIEVSMLLRESPPYDSAEVNLTLP